MGQSDKSGMTPFLMTVLLVWGVDAVRHHEVRYPLRAVSREAAELTVAVWPHVTSKPLPAALRTPAPNSGANAGVDANGMTAAERAGAADMFKSLDSIDRANAAKLRPMDAESIKKLGEVRFRKQLAASLAESSDALTVAMSDPRPDRGDRR